MWRILVVTAFLAFAGCADGALRHNDGIVPIGHYHRQRKLVEIVSSSAAPVTLTIWTTPNYDWESKLIMAVEDIVVNIGSQQLEFEPKMYLRDGATVCHGDLVAGTSISAACEQGCINKGRYCSVHYADDSLHENVLGSQIVVESARRECVWSIYGKPGGGNRADMYWNYLGALHNSTCDQSLSEDCIQATFDRLGASPHLIDQCMNENGLLGPKQDNNNPLLKDLLASSASMKIHKIPAVFVNGGLVAPNGEGDALTQSLLVPICAAYPKGQPKPLLCGCDRCTGQVQTCLQHAMCNGNNFTYAPTAAPTTAAPTTMAPMPTAAPVTTAPTQIIPTEDVVAKAAHEHAAAQAQAAAVAEQANPPSAIQKALQTVQHFLRGLSTLEIVLGGMCLGLLLGLCCVACFACRSQRQHAALYNQLIMGSDGSRGGKGPIIRIIPTAVSDDEMDPYHDEFDDDEEGSHEE